MPPRARPPIVRSVQTPEALGALRTWLGNLPASVRERGEAYDQATFDRIVADYAEFARSIGIESFTALPISGFKGDNITALSAKTPWYQGPTLIEQLETQGRVVDEAIQLEAGRKARPFGEFKRFERIVARRRQPVEQPPAPHRHQNGYNAHSDKLSDMAVRMDPLRHADLTHEACVSFRERIYGVEPGKSGTEAS